MKENFLHSSIYIFAAAESLVLNNESFYSSEMNIIVIVVTDQCSYLTVWTKEKWGEKAFFSKLLAFL